ncbi:hypothetical protein Y032_0050g2034 [Ancylostoma ceylanicum]|uniref:Uncharacterized protein n=1 Tax=Ancylostoma ceylanicum TaxID=53326 RepID=A0A016UAQ1_9BILA|nr:hypothetical protein Y032_0050g2034 [Ancylostoma ceylanicum]
MNLKVPENRDSGGLDCFQLCNHDQHTRLLRNVPESRGRKFPWVLPLTTLNVDFVDFIPIMFHRFSILLKKIPKNVRLPLVNKNGPILLETPQPNGCEPGMSGLSGCSAEAVGKKSSTEHFVQFYISVSSSRTSLSKH